MKQLYNRIMAESHVCGSGGTVPGVYPARPEGQSLSAQTRQLTS